MTERVGRAGEPFTVAHLTTVDLSLRFLLWPQLIEVLEEGGAAIGISSPGPWVDELEAAGVRHIALHSSTRGFSLGSDLRAAREFWKAIRSEEVTVLHTHNPKPGIYGRILGRLAGVPVVVNTLHGLYATETDPWAKRALVYLLEGIAARFSDAELHQNPEDLELARRLRITPRGRSRLLGNGVDLTRFDGVVDPAARQRIRMEVGAAESDVVVGVVGRLVAEKGFIELFEAVHGLDESIKVVVVGPTDPDKADSVSSERIEEARNEGVRFLGMRTDMPDVYAAMDLFVLPSHREGFPRAAMEAAAMGLPIVATDIRGCRQVVEHGVNGLLVPVRDPDSLRNAIATLADSPDVRSAMSVASRQRARALFDEERVVGTVMDTYRQVLESKGLAHLMPAAMAGSRGVVGPRPAVAADAASMANLHHDLISGGFLRQLGRRFLRVLYDGLLAWSGTSAFVVEDSGGPVGFVVGVGDVGSFYRWFLRRYWLRACWSALPALVSPGSLRRAYESLRYGGSSSEDAVSAEILSLGVAPRARGLGASKLLLSASLDGLRSMGNGAVRVVVGSTNDVAISAYERAGFVRDGVIEVHRGESSEVLVWHPG